MGEILERIKTLVAHGDASVSLHGFRELAADDIVYDEIAASIPDAVEVEEYVDFGKGPCVLVLQTDAKAIRCTACGALPRVVRDRPC